MKILRIYLKNIHSLKGEHTIDFTKPPLSETGIFAISGATGSGKSTLLDAIMLALYGQMPRFDEKISKQIVDKFGTVLTRGTDEAMAEVEYKTNGKTYRSRWSIRRNRNGNLNDYLMELAELPAGTILEQHKRNVPKRNEKIIGLNYEQFLKSIILAQGDFAKFLKAKPEERTAMLEKITGTEIYRVIGRRAFEIAREKKNNLAIQTERLNDFKILTNEQRNEYISQKSNIEVLIKQNKQKLEVEEKKLLLKKNINEINLNINELQKKISKNNSDIENFKPIEQQIAIHEELTKFKTDIYIVKSLSEEIEKHKLKIEDAQKRIKSLSDEKQIFTEKKSLLENDLQKITDKITQTQPAIEQYQNILQNLQLQEQNIKQIQEIYSKTEKKHKDNLLKINELHRQKEFLTKNLKEINNWLEENAILEKLSIDFAVIKQNLDDYNVEKINVQNAIASSRFAEKIKGNLLENSKITKQLLADYNSQISEIRQNISQKSIDELQKEYDKKISETKITEKQIEVAEELNKFTNKIAKLETEKTNLNSNLKQTEDTIRKTDNEIEIATKKLEELEKRLEREQLEAKYEDDRLKLQDNAPCPLCGSIEHPFAGKKIKHLVNQTKQNIIKTKNTLSELQDSKNTLTAKLTELQTKIKNIQNSIAEINKEIKKSDNIFTENNQKINCNFKFTQIDEIKKYYKKISEDTTKLEIQIKNHHKFSELNSKVGELNNILDKINNALSKHQQAKDRLSVYKKYYANVRNTDEILTKLSEQIKLFETNTKKSTELENKISTTEELLQEIENQQITTKTERNKLLVELKSLKTKFRASTNQLKNISNQYFNGLSADDFQKKIIEKQQVTEKNITEINNKIVRTETQLTETTQTLNELEQTLKHKQNQYQQNSQNLNIKLHKTGIKNIDEALEKLLSEDEYKQKIEQKKSLYETKAILNQNITSQKAKLQELTEKDDKDIDIQTVEQNIRELKKLIDTKNIELGRINNVLENDAEQRKNFAELNKKVEKLRQDAERWEKLNALIGDSQGKNFAAIAQQFTLSQLISKANLYLERLSDRYKLAKTSEAKHNLFVFDLYMGMSKRSVHTLSGGETFLVSLSLALALSDLASQRTRIESLFIDEGFGTLDEETLNQALNTLERLHSDTNRTIGLISHVKDIKERISTQIILTKNTTGFSTVEII